MPDNELNFTDEEAADWEAERETPPTRWIVRGVPLVVGLLVGFFLALFLMGQFKSIRHAYPQIFESVITYGPATVINPIPLYDMPNGKQINTLSTKGMQVLYELDHGCWYKIMNMQEYPYGYACMKWNKDIGYFGPDSSYR